ncbi:MAG: type IV toxin-antitoxin system AbiEi family antitoxin domain-containing protein [Rhodothermia bacterium]|nr:MAG: type IV toxin-antitoxin system AbiEi family antitoxin domain-containing protein [Rhodothermia bacterium]
MSKPSEKSVVLAEEVFKSRGGVMRTSDALDAGIQPRTLYWMRDSGLLERLSRGVYHLSSQPLPSKPDVTAVMRRTPTAILCLVSALDFHEIGTQIPTEVQIALPRNTKRPRIDYPRIRVFHMSTESMSAGVIDQKMGGDHFRVFSKTKTIADCFKFRNSIGLDVAVEALREVVRDRHVSPGEIMQYAKIDHVETVIRPYLEALV